uniref:Uncharacterized protein n=1 Tax=Astyanax mexicanus TaxID=7994 RepID=A0A3B1KA78_ASTMX
MEIRQDEVMTSDSEESTCAVDEIPDSLSDTPVHPENKSSVSDGASEQMLDDCSERRGAEDEPGEDTEKVSKSSGDEKREKKEKTDPVLQESTEKGPKKGSASSEQSKTTHQDPVAPQEQNLHSDADLPSAAPPSSGPSSSEPDLISDQKKPKTGSKNQKNQKETSNRANATLDQNANVEQSPNVRSSPHKQNQKTNQNQNQNQESKTTAGNSGKVFGPPSKPEVKSGGSSVDPDVKQGQQQPSTPKKGEASGGAKTEQPNKKAETEAKKDAPLPKRIPTSTQPVSSSERLNIYFHAVLSKDFKFDPSEDQIFVRAGDLIGDWDDNLVELHVTRELGEHGFLVEGRLSTTRKAAAVSIPYKYVVLKKKKEKYEFEYIYKLDSNQTTNRCLFVKTHLLNDEGEWHQYDDIICAEPSKNVLKKLKDVLWPDQRKSVIEGREIAGRFMLERIFDLLSSWSEINLKSFISQLRQFHQIYGNPFVFEEKQKKWFALNYDENDVSNLLKNFMLKKVTPALQKDGSGNGDYIKDPLKAAIIMLYVWKQHNLKLDRAELNRLCSALCLPNRPKEEFLPYWTDIEKSFSCLKNLPDLLVDLMNMVKLDGMTRWIVVIPLLHLLKGTSKPFEAVSPGSITRNEQTWAGLQGLKLASTNHLSSQDRRSMLNLMKGNLHLVEMDRLVSRSWLYLMHIEELMECSTVVHVELLDMLQIFILKAPSDIFYSNYTVSSDL